jgi:hypothetical protein
LMGFIFGSSRVELSVVLAICVLTSRVARRIEWS